MMGVTVRVCQPWLNVSLEDLVPANHCYRPLERTLDVSFVRDVVRDRYSAFGRPSIDPVVCFKLPLVRFFAGRRAERPLEYGGSDRRSVRWYRGYDRNQTLPDHASLTRMRDRYGIPSFRRCCEALVERGRDAGLIWGKERYADATLVEANADRDTMLPRFAVEAHLRRLFGQSYLHTETAAPSTTTTTPPAPAALGRPIPDLGADLPAERAAKLLLQQQAQHDWYAQNGQPDRSIKRGGDQRTSDLWVSLTDPDAVLMRQHNHGVQLRYRDHDLVDGGKARIILGVLVTAADVRANMPCLDLRRRACLRWKLRPRRATGDTTDGTVALIRAREDAGSRAYVPITDWEKRTSLFGRDAFRYDAETDQYPCPNGAVLKWERHDDVNQTQHYRADAARCNACPLKPNCTTSDAGRALRRSFYQE